MNIYANFRGKIVEEAPFISLFAKQTVSPGWQPPEGRTTSSSLLSMGQGSGPYVEGWGLMDEFPKGLSTMLGAQLD